MVSNSRHLSTARRARLKPAKSEGSLVSSTPGTLDVSGSAATVRVDLASVVVIRPVAGSWIGDLTGRIDLGFSYTRGGQVAQTSAYAEVTT